MKHTQIFTSQNSDISKIYMNNKQYIKAVNYRPVTTTGNSNGSLVNIKGNICSVSFPKVNAVYKIILPDNLNSTITLTINGQTTSNIVLTPTSTANDILNYIKLLSNCYNGTYNSMYTFTSVVEANCIYIYQQPEYTGCVVGNDSDPIISIDVISGSVYPLFEGFNKITSTYQSPFIVANNVNDPLVVIGSTNISDVNYLYTCTRDNTDGLGQIWELTLNSDTNESTLKLLYHSYLNFSINYPIAPSATIGRYELPNVQRIVWSDFNNPVRSINVKYPGLMGLSVGQINLVPSIDMSIPILSNVLTAAAITPLSTNMTHQCCYRLRKTNGGLSNFSALSSIVVPIGYNSNLFTNGQANYSSIDGVVTSINKALVWTVEGVDTSFDIIEFYIIQRDNANEDGVSYLINKYEEAPINGSSVISTTFTNDIDNFIPLDLNEFLIENSSFTHAKTLEQKNNRLFFGNTKNGLSNYLESYDTRAYRFNASTNTINLKKSETDTVSTIVTISSDVDYTTINETDDNIPTYNLGMDTTDDILYDSTCKFQINSTVVGGSGLNISYKFGSYLTKIDELANSPTANANFTGIKEGSSRDVAGPDFPNGMRKPGYRAGSMQDYTSGSTDQTFSMNNSRDSLALEYANGLYKTYNPNEIYRFAIVFVSKNGNSYFSKHVGDIKFPNYNDAVAPGYEGITDSGSLVTDFRSLVLDNNIAYSNNPYIIFDVNIPDNIAGLIAGYKIVRVKRKNGDKSIVAQGLINQVMNGIDSKLYLPVSDLVETKSTSYLNPITGTAEGTAKDSEVAFHSFDLLVDKQSAVEASNARLIITERYKLSNNSGFGARIWPKAVNVTGTFPSNSWSQFYFAVNKYYNLDGFVYNNTVNPILNVKGHTYVDSNGSITTINGNTYVNRDYYTGITPAVGSVNKSFAKGAPTNIVSIEAGILPMQWSTYNGSVSSSNVTENINNSGQPGIATQVVGKCKLLAQYYRPSVLKNQYGGRTYTSRTNNEYISCGQFYKVTTSGVTTAKVFGGDVFNGVLDIQKAIQQDNASLRIGLSSYQKHSQTWYFPSQSCYNPEVRIGLKANSDLNDTTILNALSNDQYQYNQAFSFEDTLIKYFPKPLEFNSTSAYQNRIYWTDSKFNGETSDSWKSIGVNSFYDLDGNYGGINCLVTLNNYMYAIQDRALALLYIDPNAMITTQDNQPIRLGISDTLSKHNYISVVTGTQHQWSVAKSSEGISFIDARAKDIFLFNGQNLTATSDIKGARGFMNKVLYGNIVTTDNPIIGKGIITTYDYPNNEFLYTFLNNNDSAEDKYTIVFSTILDEFTHFVTATPYIYVNNNSSIYSLNSYNSIDSSSLYVHNEGNYGEFYGITYPSTLKVALSPDPIQSKIFDSISILSESTQVITENNDDINNYIGDSENVPQLTDTVKTIRFYNDYQNTDWVTLTLGSNIKRIEQSWNIQIPRNKVNYDTNSINISSIFDPTILTKTTFGERMRDKYIVADLSYDNSSNNKFVLHNLVCNYRVSDR